MAVTLNSRMGNRDLQAVTESARITRSSRSGDAEDHGFNADLGVHHDRFYATVAVNETEFKGTVFTAATIEWAHGLYRNGGPVAQITRNVLDRLGR